MKRKLRLGLWLMRVVFRLISALHPPTAARLAFWVYATPRRRVFEPNEETRSLLGEAEAFPIPYSDGQLRGWAWGPKQARTVVVAHGWSDSPMGVLPLLVALREAGFRVLTFEAHGHGAHGAKKSSPVKFADGILAAAGVVPNPYAVVAHSLAAGATVMASRIGLSAERLVLISPLTSVPDHTEQFGDKVGFSRDVMRRMRKIAWEYSEPSSSNYGQDWDEVFQAPGRPGVLVFHDSTDRIVPRSHINRLLRAWPASQFIETHALGHHRILQDATVVKQLTSFLTAEDALLAASG